MAKADVRWVLRAAAVAVALGVIGSYSGVSLGRADEKGDEAIKESLLKLNRVSGEDAQLAKVRELVKDKEKGKRAVAVAAKMMKAAEKEKPFNYNGSWILGRSAHFLKEYDTAKLFYEQCVAAATKIESWDKVLTAYDGVADVLWETKKYQALVSLCEKVVDLKTSDEFEGAKIAFLERLVQAKVKLNQTDEALRITEGLINLEEVGWYFAPLKGWVLYESGKLDAAIEAYQEAIDKIEGTKNLKREVKDRQKDRVRYILSSLYVDKKDIDNAAKQLETLIKRNPDNPTYKNDLGFIWCDHDMKLDESEKLIREALDLDRKRQEKAKEEGRIDEVKENAAYLDSMGWVLFKKKEYKEALNYLKKAAADEDDGNHLEIWDHLADCYMALGQKQEAIDAWQKGLQMEDISPRDAERRKKVAAKLKAQGVEPKGPPKKKIID